MRSKTVRRALNRKHAKAHTPEEKTITGGPNITGGELKKTGDGGGRNSPCCPDEEPPLNI